MISFGVPAGAMIANHELNSKPGKPDSDTVGTSANCGRRCGVVTPISLQPCRRCTSEVDRREALEGAPAPRPPATPTAACVAPLYGTCVS